MFSWPGQGAGMINTAAGVVGVGGSVDVNSGDNGGSWDISGRGMLVVGRLLGGGMLTVRRVSAVGVSAMRMMLAVKGQEWVG